MPICRIPHLLLLALTLLTATVPADGQSKRLRGFGTADEKLRVRSFGTLDRLRSQVSQADRDSGTAMVRRYDRNRNGIIDPDELKKTGWSSESLRLTDLNGDGRVPVDEMILRYTEYRLSKETKSASKPSPSSSSSGPFTPGISARPIDPLVASRRSMCQRMAAEIIKDYDQNGDKRLERVEWRRPNSRFGSVGGADADADGRVTSEELATWLEARLPPLATARLAASLRHLDLDYDGQLTPAEFAPDLDRARLETFKDYDRNNDGLITSDESATLTPRVEAVFANEQVHVIQSQGLVASTIFVDEDVFIADLDIRIELTKQSDDELQLSLLGPAGQRVLLFRGKWQPWHRGYIFDNTLLDDEAKKVVGLSRPPANKTFPPEGAGNPEVPSLSTFYGTSARGEWRLVIRNLDHRAYSGALHRWSMIIKRAEGPGDAVAEKTGADESDKAEQVDAGTKADVPPPGSGR